MLKITMKFQTIFIVSLLLVVCLSAVVVVYGQDTSIGESSDAVATDNDVLDVANIIDTVYIGDFEYVLYDNSTATVSGYTGSSTDVVISASISYASKDFSVTEIGDNAFNKTTYIVSVSIPDSVLSIGASAFDNCTSLTTVTIGSGVTAIGSYAFNYCKVLTTVNYSASCNVASIGSRAFYLCYKLIDIVIPDSVISIGAEAYSVEGKNTYSNSSTNIKIGSGVESIGKLAFYNYKEDSESTIEINPSNASFVCENGIIYGINEEKTKTSVVMCSYSKTGSIEIPSTITVISDYAFYKANITEITFAEGSQLTSIKTHAFEESKIISITIPSKVDDIEEYSFQSCSSLTKVTFEDSDESVADVFIGEYAFYGSPLETVSFTTSWKIQVIGDYAFRTVGTGSTPTLCQFGAKSNSILIPATVKSIGDYAFYRSEVSEISFTSGSLIESVGNYAFDLWGISGISQKLDISECSHLETVGNYAFCALSRESISNDILLLPTVSVLSIINNSSFGYLNGESLSIPDSVKEIGDGAFGTWIAMSFGDDPLIESIGAASLKGTGLLDMSKCTNLEYLAYNFAMGFENIQLPAGIVVDSDGIILLDANKTQYLNSVLNLNVADEGITITEDTKVINLYVIRNAVVSIEGSNDYFTVTDNILYCNGGKYLLKAQSDLDSVTIGDDVEYVYPYAFYGCSSLSYVKVEGTSTEIDNNAFKGCSELNVFISNLTDSSKINGGAFVDCGNVKIFVPSSNDSISENEYAVFGGYIRGIPVNENDVYIVSDISYIVSVDSDEFTFSFKNGYTYNDVILSVGGNEISSSNGIYSIAVESETIIDVVAKDRTASETNAITVTFKSTDGVFTDGGTEKCLKLTSGLSIIDSEIPEVTRNCYSVKWYDESTSQLYDFTSPMTSDLVLYAVWFERDPIVSFESEHGAISESNGLISGSSVEMNAQITLSYKADSNWEFSYWVVNGASQDNIVSTIVLTITEDTTVSVVSVYSSSSNDLTSITDIDAPTASEISRVVLQWCTNNVVDTSNMSVWVGQSSVPLIVGDYVYIHVMDTLYKIESDTGYIVKASVTSNVVTAYYHYLGYGGGYIVDSSTGYVYDLDLNMVYVVPDGVTSVSYNDGYFYGLVGTNLIKFSSIDEDIEKINEQKTGTSISIGATTGDNYGTFASPVFVGDYAYYITSSGDERMLISISLKDNYLVDTIILTEISAHLLDDGWLTYYEGRLYLTSYTTGLFGAVVASGASTITSVAVNSDGSFDHNDVKYTPVSAGDKTIRSVLSKFVIYEGRGYLYASASMSEGYLIVYDVYSDGTLDCIYCESGSGSHGSIVVDTSKASVTNGNLVTIYLIAYSNSCDVYVFTDTNYKTTASEPVILELPSECPREYNSQAVRIGLDGQLIWYNDSGRVFSLIVPEDNPYYFFINDGESARWVVGYGATAEDALSTLSDYVSLSGSSVYGARVSTDESFTYSWYLYALYSKNIGSYDWNELTSMSDSNYATSHYYILTTSEDVTLVAGSNWSYDSVSEYSFANNIGDKSVVGESLTLSSVSAVRYSVNGGSEGAPTQIDVYSGETFIIKSYGGTKDGYSFGGWNDGSTTYQPGHNYTLGEDNVVFTAVWIPIYTVSYQTFVGEDISAQIKIKAATEEKTKEVYDGCKFTLSFTSGKTVSAASNGWTVSNGTAWKILNKTKDLSASFTSSDGKILTICFNYILPPTNDVSYNEGTINLASLPDGVVKNGYILKGWNTEEDGSGTTYSVGDKYNLSGNVTLYAVWEVNENNQIISFSIGSSAGVINGSSITISVPFGTDVSSLVATFTLSEGATVKVGENFQSSESTVSVNYIVTSKDESSSVEYTVAVTILDPIYSICSSTPTSSDGKISFEFSVEKTSGLCDITNANLYIIAQYEGGNYLSMYSSIVIVGGIGSATLGVTSDGLVEVFAYIVNGTPSDIFTDYGVYSYEIPISG